MSQDQERLEATRDFEPVKEVLVIQGSPRGDQGRTADCLGWFLEGVQEAGGRSEVVYLRKLKINHCLGCYTCWTRTPGRCVHNDDMAGLLEKLKTARTIVLAQPVYVYSVPGLTKDFQDRSLPLIQPFMEVDPQGRTIHPMRWPAKRRYVILSVCGFPEPANFNPMRDMFRHSYRRSEAVIVGELFRPDAESLPRGELLGPGFGRTKEAFIRAGRELVEQGFVSQAAEAAVQTPLLKDLETFRSLANAWWRISIDYYQAKAQGQDLPGLEEYAMAQPGLILTGMAAFMDPAAADGLEATIQFELEEPQAAYYLVIKEGRARCFQGRAEDPTLTLSAPWPVWLAVSRGELNGQEAFTGGKIKAQGDLGLLMRFDRLFRG